MNKTKKQGFFLLQIFAEDGGAAGEPTGSMSTETSTADDSGQLATDTNAGDNSAQTVDKKQAFQDLINGDYKDEYTNYFESQLSRRIKSRDAKIKAADEYRGKITPVLDKLAAKYGITDVNDIDAIIAEVDKDNSYYQDYASKHGVSVEQAKILISAEKIQREETQRQQDAAERQAFDAKLQNWMQQAETVKQMYPSFDFQSEYESENDGFRRLIFAGTDVKTAYEVAHHNEIMSGALAYGYQRSKKEMADSRTMRNQRPNENGVSSQQTANIVDDINKLTKEQKKKINDAVYRGEKVTPDNFRQYL